MKKYKIISFTILTLFICMIFGKLSIWQFNRLNEKIEIISKINYSLENPAQEFSSFNIDEYQKIIINGNFIATKPLFFYGTYDQGKFRGEPGYYIYNFFKSEDGIYFVVNKGWVPENLVNSFDLEPQSNTHTIEAIVTKARKLNISPDNNFIQRKIYNLDIEEISKEFNIEFSKFVLNEYRDNNNNFPLPKNIKNNIRNYHLTYALTWLSLAIITFFYLILYIRYSKKTS